MIPYVCATTISAYHAYYIAHFLRPTDLEELLAHLFRLSSHLLDLLLLSGEALVLVRG